MKTWFLLGCSAAVIVAAALPAAAQNPGYNYTTVYGARPPYSPYAAGARGPSAEEWTQYENDYSGTLGRQGLGADPRHPEGPGNAVSPR